MGGKFAVFFGRWIDEGALKNYNIGPYNDLYYNFVLFKRPRAFFKRPVNFSYVLECESIK